MIVTLVSYDLVIPLLYVFLNQLYVKNSKRSERRDFCSVEWATTAVDLLLMELETDLSARGLRSL